MKVRAFGYALCISVIAVLPTGCGGTQPPIGVPASAPRSAVATLPASLLYVEGGPSSTRHPSVEVFNAEDSSNPQPIYTIGPKGGGEYGLLAVNGSNDLFAVSYFANGAELLIFPSGKTQPRIVCLLDAVPRATFIARNTFYFTTQKYTIEEYALPFVSERGKVVQNRRRS